MSWCTIESDPGVFTELIEGIGVTGVEVQEVYALDPGLLASLGQIHGFIFLFKHTRQNQSALTPYQHADLYFAKQVVQNACATQAILNILMNTPGINLGAELDGLKAQAQDLDSESRGVAIGQSELIRSVHNSFHPQTLFSIEDHLKAPADDNYHFVGYIPFAGQVLELDGLKAEANKVGEVGEGGWIEAVTPVIQARMQQNASAEVTFSLLAITESKLAGIEAQLAVETEEEEKRRLVQALNEECAKREQWKRENLRRKHNFIPLILTLLRQVARESHKAS